MPSGDITYVHGGVADLTSQVGNAAARLMEIHDDVLTKTTQLQPFFEGEAERRSRPGGEILKGLDGLIQIVMTHGSKIMESSEWPTLWMSTSVPASK